jgi:hypothetical protein
MVRELVERAQGVFDALHGAERIFGIEVCRPAAWELWTRGARRCAGVKLEKVGGRGGQFG